MFDFFIGLGQTLSFTIMFVVVMFVYFGAKHFGLFITWRCGGCGKINETNFFKFIIGWCDHMGDYN